MGSRIAQLTPEQAWADIQFSIMDHFTWYVTAHEFTSLAADTNSSVAVVANTHGGVVRINTGDATDNNEAGIHTTSALFKMAANTTIEAEAAIKFSQINTNAANVCFAVANTVGAANTLLDDGGGPAASYDGAYIYVADGGTAWICESSDNTTQTSTTTQHTAGGSSYQRLGIRFTGGQGGDQRVEYFLDGAQMLDTNGKPIAHTIANGTFTNMKAGVYGKAGAENTLTVDVDWFRASATPIAS